MLEGIENSTAPFDIVLKDCCVVSKKTRVLEDIDLCLLGETSVSNLKYLSWGHGRPEPINVKIACKEENTVINVELIAVVLEKPQDDMHTITISKEALDLLDHYMRFHEKTEYSEAIIAMDETIEGLKF